MKEMSCKQLGGACELIFQAETFKEMMELSQQHGMDMFNQKDEPHMIAISKMQNLIKSPTAMQEWMESKERDFDALLEV
jgi:hypothetical protein